MKYKNNILLTALSKYRKIVSNNTNDSFSVQSQPALLNSFNDLHESWFSVSSFVVDRFVTESWIRDTFRTIGFNLASNKVFLIGAFIPRDGFSDATAQVCSCDGKNKCNNNGSFRITPATVNKKTISSSSYGDALPAVLLQYTINFYLRRNRRKNKQIMNDKMHLQYDSHFHIFFFNFIDFSI